MQFQPTISVADNGITPIFNTTVGLDGAQSSTTVGTKRGMFPNLWLVVPYILCTAQNVTLTFQTLINGAWASSLDVPTGYSGGNNTITANASAQAGFSIRLYGETNIFITNGATGPTILDLGRPYLTNVDPGNTP